MKGAVTPQFDWLELEEHNPSDPLAFEDAEWIERRALAKNPDMGLLSIGAVVQKVLPVVATVEPRQSNHTVVPLTRTKKLTPIRHPKSRQWRKQAGM